MPFYIHIANGQKYKILEGGRAFLDTLEFHLGVVPRAITDALMPTHPADECGDPGYLTFQPITAPYPTVSGTTGTKGTTPADIPVIVFDHTAGDFTVENGYFTDPADGDVVVMAQQMDVPFACSAPGQVFVTDGLFELDTEVL